MNIPPARAFLSYSHEDEPYRKQLVAHLAALERARRISSWHDGRIQPGSEWSEAINKELRRADIILALVSSSFLASDYSIRVELEKALARHESRRSILVPIIVRPVVLAGTPFAPMEALPTRAKPVSEWHNPDAAWKDVVEGIMLVAREIEGRKKAFLERVVPEILFAWYARRLPPVEGEEDPTIARNVQRLDSKFPELGRKVGAFRDEVRESLSKTWETVWGSYDADFVVSSRILPVAALALCGRLEALLKLSAKELGILDELSQAHLKHSFFGLPHWTESMKDCQEVANATADYWKRTTQVLNRSTELTNELRDIGARGASDDFEEPQNG